MPSIRFDQDECELRIKLAGITPDEAYRHFLDLGAFLRQFGERRWACLGTVIVSELTAKTWDALNDKAVLPVACTFCRIEQRKTKDKMAKACPF